MRALYAVLLSALTINFAIAEDTVNATPENVQADVTDDIRVTDHPRIREFVSGHEGVLLKFRPNENLPEITSEELLQGYGSKEVMDRLNKGVDKVGTLPKLKLIPCDVGCDTDEYKAAAREFLTRYHKAVENGHFTYRGTMRVKVRWFNVKSWMARSLSLPVDDVFAISFPIEGKLFTLSTTQSGKDLKIHDLIARSAGRFFLMMVGEIGLGMKPTPLQWMLPDTERSFLRKFNDATAPAAQFLGKLMLKEDKRSRLEPMTEADEELLPAIDGINPNEIDPITEPVLFNGLS